MNNVKESMLSLIAKDMKNFAMNIEKGNFENYYEISKTHSKLIAIMEKAVFASGMVEETYNEESYVIAQPVVKETNQVNEENTVLNNEVSIQNVDALVGELFNFTNKKNGGIVNEFKKFRQQMIEQPETMFLNWMQEKAKFNSKDVPMNTYAQALSAWLNKDKVEVESTVVIPVLEEKLVEEKVLDVHPIFVKEEDKKIKKTKKPMVIEGVFKLQNTGGILNGIAIPEAIVRKRKLNEGDLIRLVEDLKIKDDFKFGVQLVQGNYEQVDSKVQSFDFGIVEKCNETKLCVIRNVNDVYLSDVSGRENYVYEIPYDIIIDQALSEGDIVDIRWFKNAFPSSIMLTYKHEIDQEEKKTIMGKMLESQAKIAKEKDEENSNSHKIDLEGKNILVVGYEGKECDWKKIIEANNGVFDFYNVKKNSSNLDSLINKSDIVLLAENKTSHRGFWDSKELAKELNKPYLKFNSVGNNALIIRLESYLEQPETDDSVVIDTQYDLDVKLAYFKKNCNKPSEQNDMYEYAIAISNALVPDVLLSKSKLSKYKKDKNRVEKFLKNFKF